jgi:PhoPQ-activated pathogenicity-related protein
LWTADSPDRDLRNDRWGSVEIPSHPGNKAGTKIERPAEGFRAYLMEAEFVTKTGQTYRLSTEARVTPDTAPKP